MLALVRKFIVAALSSGAIVTELETLDSHEAKVIAIVITAIVNAIGVYAVPNGGVVARNVQPPAGT